MNGLQTFSFKNQEIRALAIDGEPYFVGKEVATILGYQNGSRDVNRHVDEEDRRYYRIGTPSGEQEATIINESGLYSLILSSKLPTAKEFKRWVTSEVLPAIRKHGAYATPATIESIIANPDNGIRLLQALKAEQNKRKEFEAKNAEMTPKALFADAVAQSDTSILVYDLAKLICQNGVNIGGTRLWAWLRDNGYIFKHSCEPTQKSMEMKLFEVIERTVQRSGHAPKVTRTTRVTGKGQQYFINKLLGS